MKFLLQITKMALNFNIINITCLSNPKKFTGLINEKCLDKKFDILKEFDSLDRYYKYLNKKLFKKSEKIISEKKI